MIKLKAKNLKCKTAVKNVKVLSFTLWLYVLTFTLYAPPVYADVKIGEKFGFGGLASLGEVTSRIVTPIFSIAAAAVIIFFLWGAFKWLKSGGNKEEIAGARQIITHTIAGFILLIFAFLILQFLLSSLFGIKDFQLFKT